MSDSLLKKTFPTTDNAFMIVVKLDKLLVERKLTLSELARRVGITVPNLSLLKTGKVKEIRFALLDALCRELDCQPAEILGRDGASAGRHGPAPALPARMPASAGIDFID